MQQRLPWGKRQHHTVPAGLQPPPASPYIAWAQHTQTEAHSHAKPPEAGAHTGCHAAHHEMRQFS